MGKNLLQFNYYIIFSTTQTGTEYNPVVPLNTYDCYQTTHIWDEELDRIIPALWYVLHLPRIGPDVFEIDVDILLHSHDEPHNILIFPFSITNSQLNIEMKYRIVNPTLIICTDNIYEEVVKIFNAEKSLLGIHRVSDLNTELLQRHWKLLSSAVRNYYSEAKECIVAPNFRLLSSNERKILPLIPFANQFGWTKQLVDEIEKMNYANTANKYAIEMRKRIIEISRIVAEKDPNVKNSIEKALIENRNFNGIPLVITFPGTTSNQIKRFKRKKDLPSNEKEIIDIIGYHRSLAKNSLFLSLEQISEEMFSELANLEEHCKSSHSINNNFVWRTLRRIGKLLNNRLRQSKIDIIRYVSQITVFSDFPIGLAILPGCTAPLCCIKPISYRPLTPLTRALQCEMPKRHQVYLGKKLKILVAECVHKEDKIRHYCDALTIALTDMVNKESDVSIVIEEVPTVNIFKNIIKNHNDADILLVSAHGNYDVYSNMAGLIIGDEIWMANDNDIRVPPVVLLNACHVMPRGRGAVTVGDLFIRNGATAVLGTFIPIDVRRNAILITRLFTDIFEVRKGWSNMRTLDEIWSHVVSTNAIHEIIAPTNSHESKLEKWANTKKEDGTFPQAEFKNRFSVGRLRTTHVYEDTEKILGEMADKDGIGEYYRSYIKSNGYFPESLFYQFIGMPENIFIRNDIIKQRYDMHST